VLATGGEWRSSAWRPDDFNRRVPNTVAQGASLRSEVWRIHNTSIGTQ
jgi:hypothetical protein